MTKQSDQSYPQVARLLSIMQQLRDPEGGCPWDLQQNFASIVPYTIEEAYEVADAIEQGDMKEVQDELGDLLFQVVFYAQLGKEQGDFDFEAIAKSISDKLVRRHPHVFGEQNSRDAGQVKQQWEQIKQQERRDKGQDNDTSILAHIPAGLAPLVKAEKLQKRCAKVGFDWPEVSQVVDKIHEEIDEVQQELAQAVLNRPAVQEEVGDLLFAVVNLARHLNVNPEQALRQANNKFEQRFRGVEQILRQQALPVEQASLEQMEAAWQQVKQAGDRLIHKGAL